MSLCAAQIQRHLFQVASNSGHSLMSFGQYYDCLDLSPALKYFFLTITMLNELGLCLPIQCQQLQITQYVNQLFTNRSLQAQVTDISNVYEWSFYLALFIILLFVFFVIYSTLLTYFNVQTKINMFSIQKSLKNFKRNPKNNLNVFNGLKSLAMMNVILLHAFRNPFFNINDKQNIQKYLSNPFFLVVNAGAMVVGLFLFIGGFLVSYVLLKADWDKISTIFINIVNRMFRILPALLFVIMIYGCIYVYVGSGVLWGIIFRTSHISIVQIITTIFFISNYTGMPYSVAWYIYVDMQIFIITMPILFLYKRSKLISKILLWILIAVGLIQSFVYAQINNVPELSSMKSASLRGKFNGQQSTKPYLWIPIYMLGVFLGILYMQYLQQIKTKQNSKQKIPQIDEQSLQQAQLPSIPKQSQKGILLKIKQKIMDNKKMIFTIEIIGGIIILFNIFITRTLQLHYEWPQILHSLSVSLRVFLFCLGLSIAIIPSLLSLKQSILLFIMDTSLFNFLAKVSYSTYLIHATVNSIWYASRSYNQCFSYVNSFVQVVSIIIISVCLGFIITITIEFPFGILQKSVVNKLKQWLGASKKE